MTNKAAYKNIYLILSLVSLSSTVDMSTLSEKFSKCNSLFSADIFKTVSKSESDDKNIIISPFSVQTCVGLAYAGASGETSKEIAAGLKLVSEDKEESGAAFSEVLDTYESSPLINIANKIYVHQDYTLKAKFNEIASKYFKSEADTIDVSDPDAAAQKVNQWVEAKTNEKIKDLISSDNINDLTRLVLVNAIHFKGNWSKKFDPEDTLKEEFYFNEEESQMVDMMKQKSKFRYAVLEELDATALEMPYADSDLSMLVILPNSRTGLADLESKISGSSLNSISEKMFEQEVHVSFPKFKVEYSKELTPVLKEMGIQKMFSDDAEFDDMLESTEPLKVSKVIHKAFIEVNEEGTEAAAATGMIMMMRCALIEERIEFIADHPFLYAIWDKKQVLFAGKNTKL